MSSFVFKIIAIITMFIDHLGYVVYLRGSWMNYIGRLAFPIFAWQISIGYQKTKNINLYMYRLFITALISQAFYMVYMSTLGVSIENIDINVIATLLLGLICIRIYDKNKYIGILSIIISCIIAQLLNFEYGFYGIIMIVAFYIFKDNKYLCIIAQAINLVIYLIINNIDNIGKGNYIQAISMISIIAVSVLYNGKQGKKCKYMFYAFYPLQFLALALLTMYLYG